MSESEWTDNWNDSGSGIMETNFPVRRRRTEAINLPK